MELKKAQKQGRDERTQEDYPTSAVYFCRCRVVFLRSFISSLFLCFFQLHPYLKSSFTEVFSLVYVVSSVIVSTRQALEKLALFHYSYTTVLNNVVCRAIIDALLGPPASTEQRNK